MQSLHFTQKHCPFPIHSPLRSPCPTALTKRQGISLLPAYLILSKVPGGFRLRVAGLVCGKSSALKHHNLFSWKAIPRWNATVLNHAVQIQETSNRFLYIIQQMQSVKSRHWAGKNKLVLWVSPPEPPLSSQRRAGGQRSSAGRCLACRALEQTPGSHTVPPGTRSSWGWQKNDTDSRAALGLPSCRSCRRQFSQIDTP